jgi:hypothetical protein
MAFTDLIILVKIIEILQPVGFDKENNRAGGGQRDYNII